MSNVVQVAQDRVNEASKRFRTIPVIGIIGAIAIAAIVTDPKAFRSGRDFTAWIGLVPRQTHRRACREGTAGSTA
jgi:transposase